MRRLLTYSAFPLVLSCGSGMSGTVSPNAFADGLVAVVDRVNDPAWPHDALTVDSATVASDTLRLWVRFGGGCRTHRFALLLSRAFMESYPVQVHAELAHDGAGDPCDARLTRRLEFDRTTLKQRNRAASGAGGGAATIVIHLVGHGQSVRYIFD
ncbi:MAG: hypothetical protein ACREOG_02705 [Gemmatimonadaceae bacterium]